MHWPWAQMEPYYEELAARTTQLLPGLETWLADWSQLGLLVYETYQRLYVAITVDTTDQMPNSAMTPFWTRSSPPPRPPSSSLKKNCSPAVWSRPDLRSRCATCALEAALFREANLPLLSEDLKLGTRI